MTPDQIIALAQAHAEANHHHDGRFRRAEIRHEQHCASAALHGCTCTPTILSGEAVEARYKGTTPDEIMILLPKSTT